MFRFIQDSWESHAPGRQLYHTCDGQCLNYSTPCNGKCIEGLIFLVNQIKIVFMNFYKNE